MMKVDYFRHAGSGHPDVFSQSVNNTSQFTGEQKQYKERGLMCQPEAAGRWLNPSSIFPVAANTGDRPSLFFDNLLENILDPFLKAFLESLLRHVCSRFLYCSFVNIRI
jgi:hypothetical protein